MSDGFCCLIHTADKNWGTSEDVRKHVRLLLCGVTAELQDERAQIRVNVTIFRCLIAAIRFKL